MSKPLKVFFGCFGAFVVICGLGGWLVWRTSDFGQAAAQLDQAVADAKAAGLPWMASDLDQHPPVKAAENAAGVIREALEASTKDSATKQALTDLGKGRTDDDQAEESAALDRLTAWIALARKAGDLPRCDFHRDWDQGVWLMLPEMATEREMAKVLGSYAEREARRGDVAEAIKDLRRAVVVGRHAGSDPNVIGMLVQIADDAIAMRGFERVMEAVHQRPAELEEVRKGLADLGPGVDFKRALRGEQFMAVAVTRNLRSWRDIKALAGGDDAAQVARPKEFVRSGLPPTLMGKIFLCRALQMWTKVVTRSKDESDPIRISVELDKAAEREDRAGWSHMLDSILVPVFTQAGTATVTMTATRSATRGLAAVLEFRAKNGRYPKTLAEAKFTDSDPFTGKPLLFKVEGESCKVYSVGSDKEDNGGVRQSDRPSNLREGQAWHWDVVASYPAYHRVKDPRVRAPKR